MPIQIGFLGAPGTGKSSLAWLLVEALQPFGGAELVSEFARQFISEHSLQGEPLPGYAQSIFFQHQLHWEEAATMGGRRWIVSDTCVFLPYIYSLQFYNESLPRAIDTRILGDLYGHTLMLLGRYDFLIFLKPVLPPSEDNVRTVENQSLYDGAIRGFIDLHHARLDRKGVTLIEPDKEPYKDGLCWKELTRERLEFVLRSIKEETDV